MNIFDKIKSNKWLKEDNNIIRILTTVITIIVVPVIIFLTIQKKLPIESAVNAIGIIYNLAGALWMASAVYLFKKDKDALKAKPNRSKLGKFIVNSMRDASRTIFIGVLCLVVGSVLQLFVALDPIFNIFKYLN